MNRSNIFYKSLVTLVAVLLIVMFASVYFKPSETMLRSPEQVMEVLQTETHLTPLDSYLGLPKDARLLVDLRSGHQYQQGHLEDAVNLPLGSLDKASERDRIEKALDSGKKVFLYAERMIDAEGAWMMLYQMGLDGMRVLRIDVYSDMQEVKITEQEEAIKMDYAEIYKDLSTKPVIQARPQPKPKRNIQPVKKKKKKVPEGGC